MEAYQQLETLEHEVRGLITELRDLLDQGLVEGSLGQSDEALDAQHPKPVEELV